MLNSRFRRELYRFEILMLVIVGLSMGQLFLIDHLAKKFRGDYPLLNETKESVTKTEFLANKEEIDTIILGDSHAGQSYNNLIMPSWFKATHAGEDIVLSLMKLKYFLDQSDKIRQVIVPLDYHSLSGSWGVPKQEYSIYESDRLGNLKQQLIKANPLLDDYNRKIVIRWVLSRFNKKYLPLPIETEAINATGFEEILEGDPQFLALIEARARGMLHPPIIDPTSVQAIEEIARICNEKGINLIGIRYPLPNDFLSYVEENNLNKIDNWISDNRNLFWEIYDYRELFSDRQEYFGNEDHLNIPGSNAFTSQFVTDYFSNHKDGGWIDTFTSYPFVNPVVELLNSKNRILNLESPYGIEHNSDESWVWIGRGEMKALKLIIHSETENVSRLRISYFSQEGSSINILLNDQNLVYQVENDSLSSMIDLRVGINNITIVSMSDLRLNSIPTTSDVRDLSVRINLIVLD